MIEKFKNIPVDDDTRILATTVERIEGYDVAYQKWSWDGTYGESIIFFNEEVKSLSKEDILELVQKANFIVLGSGITYKQGDIYTFLNFNFKVG